MNFNNSVIRDLGEMNFSSQEDILEAHQIMINQLRDNIIKLANQNVQLYSLVEKLYNAFEENDIKIVSNDNDDNDDNE